MKPQIPDIDEEYSMQSDSDFSPEDSPSYQPVTQKRERLKKPKRNKSAFILFSSDMRPKIKSETNSNSNEMMVQLAKMWKELPSDQRQEYTKKAKLDKERYNLELASYAKTHPAKMIHNKTKNNHVKKPCSAYALFVKSVKETTKTENQGLKMAELFKIISQKWKEISQTERAKFEGLAEEEKRIAEEKKSEIKASKEEEEKAPSKKRGPKNKKEKETHPAPKDIGEKYKRKPRAAKLKAQSKIDSLYLEDSDSIEQIKFIEQKELDKITEATTKSSAGSEETPKIIFFEEQFEPPFMNLLSVQLDSEMDFSKEIDENILSTNNMNYSCFQKINEFEIDLLDFGFKREFSQNFSFTGEL